MEYRWGFLLLLSVQLLSARLSVSHSLFLCLWGFFPFNSRFWLKKGNAEERSPSQLEQLPTQLGCDSAWFHWFPLAFPVGISFWDEHPPFMAPLLAQLHLSHCDPWGSGGKAGAEAGMDCRRNRLFPSGLSTPIPCHSSDSEGLVFLHHHCRKVGMLWWAAAQAAPLCGDAVAQLLWRSPGVLGKSRDTHPGARESWVAAEVKIARNLEKKKASVGCERSWKAEIMCRISFVN